MYVSFGEEKEKTKIANAALQFCIYNVTENLSIFFFTTFYFDILFYRKLVRMQAINTLRTWMWL